MDSLNSILGDKNFDKPTEIDELKRFIRDNYQSESEILIRGHRIIISVSSSALANSLRLRMPEIKRELKIERDLSFRIH
jgi:hypothetical protein